MENPVLKSQFNTPKYKAFSNAGQILKQASFASWNINTYNKLPHLTYINVFVSKNHYAKWYISALKRLFNN